MKFGHRILGLLLSAALVMAALSTGALTAAEHGSGTGLLPAPSQRPTACHMHGGKGLPDSQLPHSPRPASYECCLTGHDVAAVQAPHHIAPSCGWTPVAQQGAPALIHCSFNGYEVTMLLSAAPPGLAPLRI